MCTGNGGISECYTRMLEGGTDFDFRSLNVETSVHLIRLNVTRKYELKYKIGETKSITNVSLTFSSPDTRMYKKAMLANGRQYNRTNIDRMYSSLCFSCITKHMAIPVQIILLKCIVQFS